MPNDSCSNLDNWRTSPRRPRPLLLLLSSSPHPEETDKDWAHLRKIAAVWVVVVAAVELEMGIWSRFDGQGCSVGDL